MSRSDLLNPPRMLPDMVLPDRSGTPRRVRASGDRSVLLVLVHSRCHTCREWLERLGEQKDEVEDWKGEMKVVASSPEENRLDAFTLLVDPRGRLATALGVTEPAVVIADQWGGIHEADQAGEEHAILSIASVVEWIRHLATECPECEGEAY